MRLHAGVVKSEYQNAKEIERHHISVLCNEALVHITLWWIQIQIKNSILLPIYIAFFIYTFILFKYNAIYTLNIPTKLPQTSPGAPLKVKGAPWDIKGNPICMIAVIYMGITGLIHETFNYDAFTMEILH